MKRRLLDYYRQFEELSPEEDSRRLRAKRDAEKSQELARVPPLDLSRPDWHEPPDPELVNAATFALRRSINRYPEADSATARAAIAQACDVRPEQVALGHGAGQLLQATLRSLGSGEVVIPWPAWSPLLGLAARAGLRPVTTGLAVDDVLAAVGDETRAVLVCSPNDPTGHVVAVDDVRRVATAAGQDVLVLVDEALIEFAGIEYSVLGLAYELPNVVVYRSFSKAWALAGLRAGFAVGPEATEPLLAELGPGQGVSAPAQAAVTAALENAQRSTTRLARRRDAAATERHRLSEIVADTPFSFDPSHAHFVWLRGEGFTAASLSHGLAQQRIGVASGTAWGDEHHVRITLRDKPATERLGSALRSLL